jgi:nitrogen fixation protein NifU and related proteins
MAMNYSEKVKEHFMNPRNVGEMEDADGVGEVGNPSCGDIMTFYIKVDEEENITDVKFQTFGCGAAIAVSSMVSEIAQGMTVAEAEALTRGDIVVALDGLPTSKLHCSNLGTDALKAAIQNFRNRQAGMDEAKVVIDDPDEDDEEGAACGANFAIDIAHDGNCKCPHCDLEVDADKPFCSHCGSSLQDEK